MVCNKCGKENLEGSKFCGSCGNNLVNTNEERNTSMDNTESTMKTGNSLSKFFKYSIFIIVGLKILSFILDFILNLPIDFKLFGVFDIFGMEAKDAAVGSAETDRIGYGFEKMGLSFLWFILYALITLAEVIVPIILLLKWKKDSKETKNVQRIIWTIIFYIINIIPLTIII